MVDASLTKDFIDSTIKSARDCILMVVCGAKFILNSLSSMSHLTILP